MNTEATGSEESAKIIVTGESVTGHYALNTDTLKQITQSVNDKLREALLDYAELMPMSLVTMGKKALNAPGKSLNAELSFDEEGWRPPRWPLLVILSYQAALPAAERATWEKALPGAAAVEIAMSAADLLDEIADDDPSPIVLEYGVAQALNTGNLMLVIAQRTLQKAAVEPDGDRALKALGALQEMLVEAAVGQHLDMTYESMEIAEVTPEMSLKMTEHKAGALMAGACRVGALMAGAEAQVEGLITKIGREMGGIAQLLNDIQDVLPQGIASDGEQAKHKTDLRMRKRTLPIVFTLRDESEELNSLQKAFASAGDVSIDEEELRRTVVEKGGVQFAQLVLQVHKERCLELLAELEALRPGAGQVLAPLLDVEG